MSRIFETKFEIYVILGVPEFETWDTVGRVARGGGVRGCGDNRVKKLERKSEN